MPVPYEPKDAAACLPAGTYDATLEKVEDKTSKAGNYMQVWTFRAYGDREMLVTDYVVIPAATFKIKQLAKALGKEKEFNAGTFQADDHIGAGVKLDLVVDSQDGYDDKNKVVRIKPGSEGQPPTAEPARSLPPRPQRKQVANPIGDGPGIPDEDIPFRCNDV